MTTFTIDDIARVTYEANAAYSHVLGDTSFGRWGDAPEWQKDTNRRGVRFHLANPGASPSASHEEWMRQKMREGWIYGEVKDVQHKTHPCLVPWSELSEELRCKDVLFRATVEVLRPLLGAEDVNG